MSNQTTISIYLKRDKHENGMSLQEYTDAIIAGTQPVLSQDAFAYQFGAVEDEMAVVESWATTNNLTVIESNKATSTIKVLGTFERFDSLFGISEKMCLELEGIKKELAKEDVNAQQFQSVVRDIAERAMDMQTQVQGLHAEVKSMHRDMGTALMAVKTSSDGLGKTFTAMLDSFTTVRNEVGALVKISKQDAEEIQALHKTMAAMKASMPENMASLLSSLLAPINAQLNALLENCYDLPTFVSVWRHNASVYESMKKGDAMLLLQFQFVLNIRFHCEYTLEPSSAAYEVKVTKEWVSKAKHTK